jgi:hypothetical protein
MSSYFSDFFKVSKKSLDDYGAFNISLITDLPLFIDPFLLFHSKNKDYQELHAGMIRYLEFLRDKSISQDITPGLLLAWYHFPEVKQNWLGFTLEGNSGRGLGQEFAKMLDSSLSRIFSSFGKESVTKGTHLEKLCLIKNGVGRDTISDFTTNLIKDYLLKYTQIFTEKYIEPSLTKTMSVQKVRFDYETERWESDNFILPFYRNTYVLLTPKNILTKEDVWINRKDYLHDFWEIREAVFNTQLREELDNYLKLVLSKNPKSQEYDRVAADFTYKHPEIIDLFIRSKEDRGDKAIERSAAYVADSQQLYIEQFNNLVQLLNINSLFYAMIGDTVTEAYQRITFLKDVVENKGGWKLFYVNGQPVRKEEDIQIAYRLTWFRTLSDVSREVNDGRGPADFKISRGSVDKTIVEFKLASNPQLRQNLQNQVEIYKKASDVKIGFKVIFYFSDAESKRIQDLLVELELTKDPYIIQVDARKKESASKVK